MKKKTTAFVICIFLLVALFIVYIFSELYTESDMTSNTEKVITDAEKFEKEYEDINSKLTDTGKTIRPINIDSNNPIEYITEDKLVEKINNKESFIVYFGFADCPWCRSVIQGFLDTSKEYAIEKIYYLDVKDIRDKYELNDSHELVKTKEGTKGYNELLNKLSNVLDDYEPLTYVNSKGKTKKVAINEKRIYAPNFVLVENGEAVIKVTGIPDTMTDPYIELDDSLKEYQKSEFSKVFSAFNKGVVTTTCGDTMC